MKTGNFLRLTTALTLTALFASCAPSTKDSKAYTDANVDQSNIVGGVSADLTYQQQHGIVGIFDAQKGALCTGSLIAKDLVITAAHCINTMSPKAMMVFFTTDLKKAIGRDQQGFYYDKNLVRVASKAIRHEGYVAEQDAASSSVSTKVSRSKKGSSGSVDPVSPAPSQVQNDIALIRLSADAPVEFVPATLASASLTTEIQPGSVVTLAGFGLSAYSVDPTSHMITKQGAGVLRDVDGIKVVSVKPSGSELTFDQTEGHGACHGDSGGPAYFVDAKSSKSYLIGVTSRSQGSDLGECDKQVVYTGVMGYEAWIATHSQSL